MNQERSLTQLRFGPYVTPVIVPGTVVECEVRGLVTVVGLSDGPLPWPIGERAGERELIVFKALATAVRQESPQAVAGTFGVDRTTAELWRATCKRPRGRKKQTLSSPPIHWKPTDDELIVKLSLAEAAHQTGRTVSAIRKRRRMLGLPDGRLAAHKANRLAAEGSFAEAARIRSQLRHHMDELAASLGRLNRTFRQCQATVAFWKSAL